MYTSTMVAYRDKRVIIDCGENWTGKIANLKPRALVITHPHPDHAFGLKAGSPCPVYATSAGWKNMKNFPIRKQFRKMLKLRTPERIAGITFEAFPVMHSVRAPAVGYRISAGKVILFYVPDVAWIPGRSEAFSSIRVYIGDGATLTRPLIRQDKRVRRLIGHASVQTQLGWCRKEGVPWMIVTHCGSAIVGASTRLVTAKLQDLGRTHGVKIEVAHDGMTLVLR
jgi:phosphoribosyl 1,2-cyclic phosphodiesterase